MKLTKLNDFGGIEPPSISPRTALFSLAPINKGTANQESLLSLLIRTSRAHSLSPRHLIRYVFGTDPAIAKLTYAKFFKLLAGTINGLGQYAELFVTATEGLTGQNDLHRLTLLPWKDFFPFNGQGLLARHPKWCPACLHQQRLEEQDPSFPLAWAIEPYRICREHICELEDRCPRCGSIQPFIPRYPDISLCDYCHAHLAGTRPRGTPSWLDTWLLDAIGNMLIHQTNPSFAPSLERFRAFIEKQTKIMVAGNRAAFCRTIGINNRGLNNWINKGERPAFSQFLTLCYGTGSKPSDVFMCSHTSDALRIVPSKVKARKPNPGLTAIQRNELEGLLRAYLDSNEFLPVTAIAKRLGYTPRCLRYWFPALCNTLSERHKISVKAHAKAQQALQSQRVAEIVISVHKSGRYPSRRVVNSILRQEKMSLARPHVLKAYKAAIETLAMHNPQ